VRKASLMSTMSSMCYCKAVEIINFRDRKTSSIMTLLQFTLRLLSGEHSLPTSSVIARWQFNCDQMVL
jgi:hypothetical protein